MLSSIIMKPKIFNQKLHDYCLKSTNDSIKKKVEMYNEERKNGLVKFNLLKNSFDDDDDPNKNIIPFICFLSISSFLMYIYITKK